MAEPQKTASWYENLQAAARCFGFDEREPVGEAQFTIMYARADDENFAHARFVVWC